MILLNVHSPAPHRWQRDKHRTEGFPTSLKRYSETTVHCIQLDQSPTAGRSNLHAYS